MTFSVVDRKTTIFSFFASCNFVLSKEINKQVLEIIKNNYIRFLQNCFFSLLCTRIVFNLYRQCF